MKALVVFVEVLPRGLLVARVLGVVAIVGRAAYGIAA
jgi:hypothetical protein